MITNPNTTRRQQFAIEQREANDRENRAALWMLLHKPVPELLVQIDTTKMVAAKRQKLGLS